MLTVPEAAKRAARNPETIRRWIRSGKLRSQKVGTQHIIEEHDLDAVLDEQYPMAELPEAWKTEPQINWVRMIRLPREGH